MMRASERFHSPLVATILFVAWTSAAGAAPVPHIFLLEDPSGGVVYSGSLLIDSSRLVPDLFTAFSDPSLSSLSITIGPETFNLADAFNPTTEGVITDASGNLVSFHDDTIQSVALLINGNGVRLDILEGNGSWSTTAAASVTNGPTHSIVVEAVVVACLSNEISCGDGLTRGFYLESYPADVLGTVTLRYCSSVVGARTITLTARQDTYDGPVIASVSGNVVITDPQVAEPLTFDFAEAAVTQGGILTFSQSLLSGPGPIVYDIGLAGEQCVGVVQTNSTNPPLDTFRRPNVGIIVTAPEPSAGLLLLSGSAFLLVLGRRRVRR